MTGEDWRALIAAALAARTRAYAPYSRFAVGAAILTDDGTVYTGCNVENGSLGLTLCAERVAACTAVAAGQRSWRRLAVASAGGASPCGACRQVLVEFAPALELALVDADRPAQVTYVSLADLLPMRFDFHKA